MDNSAGETVVQKILITIQGRTLILQYQVKSGLIRNGAGWKPYIQVMPSAELGRFNLRGLTPDMFCVNIADMVNVRSWLSGVVENEQQLPVARWQIDTEDYRQALSSCRLSHSQIVDLLRGLPGYVGEFDDEFIEFEAVLADQQGNVASNGYRLTIVTQDIGDKIAPYASYNLDVCNGDQWQGYPPPDQDHEALRIALTLSLAAISAAGVMVTQVYDATDYGYY